MLWLGEKSVVVSFNIMGWICSLRKFKMEMGRLLPKILHLLLEILALFFKINVFIMRDCLICRLVSPIYKQVYYLSMCRIKLWAICTSTTTNTMHISS